MRSLLAALLVASLANAAFADYPDRPIKLIVPFAAGAGTDAVARFTAQKLEEQLKQPVVVENRVGASGAIGTQAVALAPADGYTLLFVASPFTTVAAATPLTANYDPVRQFAPVALIAAGPLVWIANAQAPFGSMREMIAYARANPGKLAYGSAGAGGVNHLALELLMARTGTTTSAGAATGVSRVILRKAMRKVSAAANDATGPASVSRMPVSSGRVSSLEAINAT